MTDQLPHVLSATIDTDLSIYWTIECPYAVLPPSAERICAWSDEPLMCEWNDWQYLGEGDVSDTHPRDCGGRENASGVHVHLTDELGCTVVEQLDAYGWEDGFGWSAEVPLVLPMQVTIEWTGEGGCTLTRVTP